MARGCVERRLKSVRAGAEGEIGRWVGKLRIQGVRLGKIAMKIYFGSPRAP